MHDQVERVIERRDRGDHADRLADRECPAILRRSGEAHRDLAAAEVAQLVGPIAHAVDRARDLDRRIGIRFAALACDQPREALALHVETFRQVLQDRDPLMRL